MTTIISQDSVFTAADELWTDAEDRPAPAPFKKFYALNDSLLFFSGDIDAILSALSMYIGSLIGVDEEFAELMGQAAELDMRTYELIEIDRSTGKIVYEYGSSRIEEHGCIFYGLGSGSDYALNSFINSMGIILNSGKPFKFPEHGHNLITTCMQHAFQLDECSGGKIAHIVWGDDGVVSDCLAWVPSPELESYHCAIIAKIHERFGTKEELRELIAGQLDEEKQDAKELEIETKIFDQVDDRAYSSQNSLAAKGRTSMNNTTEQKPRVAVKTSGSSRGKVFSSAALKERMAQRKAEGLS
ncbi:hypothetical protein OGX90_09875 [Citrobacter sp. Cpo012]|uniref:hypothetical protein n=1 Tax=Citrobacter sp. Cpo012 TaxID=2985120 RepID=UPI0025776141|nr:hypothetical protein [Citrobacter sp. Cpo012]MDM2910221.1 hypothetical protein [Citrobacter sp. Cpo012]